MPVCCYQHCFVWTFISLSITQTSNFLHSLTTFGLLLAFPQLQGPIHHFPSLRLDFFHCLTTSKSNPPHFYTSFGLPPASTPLQGPIRHTLALRLDFLRVSHHFQVHSATLISGQKEKHDRVAVFTVDTDRVLIIK